MRIAYLGTGEIGLPILKGLAGSAHQIMLVVTQPDRPAGRGLKTVPGPVKEWAAATGAAIFQPPDVNTPESVAAIAAASPDILLVVAFGQFLKREVRELARHGAINFHPSLLPRHRGAAPCQFTILSGDEVAGATIMRVERRMDAGAILGQLSSPIGIDETAGELQDRLSHLGVGLTLQVLDEIAEGQAVERTQDEAAATHSRKLTHESGRVEWARPAAELDRLIRGLSPKPGAWCRFDRGGEKPGIETVRLLRSRVGSGRVEGNAAGEVAAVREGRIVVAAGDGGTVELLELQPQNSRVMPAGDYANGRRLTAGMRFLDG